jgi:dienelactone hydrolase
MMLSLQQLIAKEINQSALPQVTEFAAFIAGHYPNAARAVLFYGSCLRSETLQGEMLDFYLIVSEYDQAYDRKWMAKWNRRLPPNVFPFQFEGLMAKVAVLSEADFHALNRPEASAVSVWARFSQPSRLVWAADDKARIMAARAIAGAAPTLLNAALAHMQREMPLAELWHTGFQLTYGAELRAERKNRPAP